MTSAMTYDDGNIFARILRGEIPCDRVMENGHVLAFRDIRPQAPVHILVIPKGKYRDAADFGANASAAEIEAFWRVVPQIAGEHGLTDRGFRIIANAGAHGGQEVPHFHVHILGGRYLGAMVGK